jgi:hypothetical protein
MSSRTLAGIAHFHDSGTFGLSNRSQVVDQSANQPDLGAGRDDGQPVQRGLGRRAQGAHPGQHGIDDRRRDVRRRISQHLGDEERIAAGQPEQLAGIDRRRRGHLADRVRGEAGQAQPGGGGTAEHAENAAQWMVPGKGVVAVGHQQNRRQVLHAGTEVAQHIERRAVGPMGVLDDEHGRRGRSRELVARRREHEIGIGVTGQRRSERSIRGRSGRISQRAQSARREQVLARAGEDPHSAIDRGQEGMHEAGLSDAGLAEHQYGRPLPRGSALDGRAEHLQLYLPLQEVGRHAHHRRIGRADR